MTTRKPSITLVSQSTSQTVPRRKPGRPPRKPRPGPSIDGSASLEANADIPPDFFENLSSQELDELSKQFTGPHEIPQEPEVERPENGARKARTDKLVMATAALYAKIGTLVFFFNRADGLTILECAEERAKELVAVAKLQPRVMKVLQAITKSNAYVELGTGHIALVLALLANHGVDIGAEIKKLFVPASRMGDSGARPEPTAPHAEAGTVPMVSTSHIGPLTQGGTDMNGNPASLMDFAARR